MSDRFRCRSLRKRAPLLEQREPLETGANRAHNRRRFAFAYAEFPALNAQARAPPLFDPINTILNV